MTEELKIKDIIVFDIMEGKSKTMELVIIEEIRKKYVGKFFDKYYILEILRIAKSGVPIFKKNKPTECFIEIVFIAKTQLFDIGNIIENAKITNVIKNSVLACEKDTNIKAFVILLPFGKKKKFKVGDKIDFIILNFESNYLSSYATVMGRLYDETFVKLSLPERFYYSNIEYDYSKQVKELFDISSSEFIEKNKSKIFEFSKYDKPEYYILELLISLTAKELGIIKPKMKIISSDKKFEKGIDIFREKYEEGTNGVIEIHTKYPETLKNDIEIIFWNDTKPYTKIHKNYFLSFFKPYCTNPLDFKYFIILTKNTSFDTTKQNKTMFNMFYYHFFRYISKKIQELNIIISGKIELDMNKLAIWENAYLNI